MTYYADGTDDPNPPIRLVPGEQVRVTFRNDDRGMLHDFGIPAFGVGTGIVEFGTEKSFDVQSARASLVRDLHLHAAFGDDVREDSLREVKWQDRFSSPERKRQYVRSLFATIADRYDLITVLLSGGLDKRWKRRLVAQDPGSPMDAAALDLACGTGDIAFELAAAGSRVIGLDITPRMVRLASLKPQRFRHACRS